MTNKARHVRALVALLALMGGGARSEAGIVADTAARLRDVYPQEPTPGQPLPDWLREMEQQVDPLDAHEAMAQAERWGGIAGAAMRAGCAWRVTFALASEHDIALARWVSVRAIRSSADAEARVEAARAANDSQETRLLAQRAQVVLPLNTARALILLAACHEHPPERQRVLELAAELLSRPTGAGAWYETERATLSAMALALSGRADQASEVLAGARKTAELINPGDDSAASRVERVLTHALVEARARSNGAGRSVLRTAIDQPPFVEHGARDWWASIMAASMHANLALQEAGEATDDRARDAVLAQALVLFERLGVQARDAGEASAVLDEAARAIDREPRLSVENDFGLAVRAITRADQPVDAERLSRVLEAGALPASVAPGAEIALVRALASSRDAAKRMEAARHAVAFGQRHPTDARAPEMLAWGASLAASLGGEPSREASIAQTLEHAINAAPDHPEADEWRRQLAASLARQAVLSSGAHAEALVDRAVETLDARRARDHTAGALLVWIGERAESEGGDAGRAFERAIESLGGVAGDGARRARVRALVGLARDDEALEEARTLMPDGLGDAASALCVALVRAGRAEDAMGPASNLGPDEAAYLESRLSRLAWARTSPMIERFPEESGGGSGLTTSWEQGAWRLVDRLGAGDPARTGWGLLLAGEARRAAGRFTNAIERGGESPGLVRGLGEALLASGDDAGAFAAFRRLAQLCEHDKQSRDYWHAQARLAEILLDQNADGSRTDTIARLVRRLRAEPGWGAHADCMARLERVSQKVGATD